MAKHLPGQITWPEPNLGKACTDCAHFVLAGFKKDAEKGRCWLVEAHQNVQGAAFSGVKAIACPKFRERDV